MKHLVTLTRTIVFEATLEIEAPNLLEAGNAAEVLGVDDNQWEIAYHSPVRACSVGPVKSSADADPSDVDLAAACSD